MTWPEREMLQQLGHRLTASAPSAQRRTDAARPVVRFITENLRPATYKAQRETVQMPAGRLWLQAWGVAIVELVTVRYGE